MLQNGASKVYSVDVGYGQLAWKLREDPRVVCMERTNARYLTHEQIPDELDVFDREAYANSPMDFYVTSWRLAMVPSRLGYWR